MRPRSTCLTLLASTLVGCVPAESERKAETKALPAETVRWDIPIEVNDDVARWLNYYQNEGRKSFKISLVRAGRYEALMRETFREAGLPEDLVYIPLIESGFKATAYSRARAMGLWQFVPNTARIYRLEMTYWVDQRLDPIAATHAAADYLGDLQREFRDWYLTLAAYNAGPGRVHQAIRKAGSRDYWTICERRALTRETRDYVPKLIAAALIAKQPERYGILHRSERIAAFDIAYVPDATSLDVVAEAAGVPIQEILALNPHLIRGVTPPGMRFAVRLPAGTARIFTETYAEIPSSDRVRSILHFVRRGETLERIARRYGTRIASIREANDDLDPTRLLAGQRLLVPGARNVPGLSD